jgi:hypothetical protein
MRRRREASTPAFEQIWRAARAQQTSAEAKLAWPWWKLAGASAVAALLAVFIAFYTASERKHRRQQERDFATLDGILITYWQAPSDDLLSMGSRAEFSTKDE